MSANILDQLYTPEGKGMAIEWLWSNAVNLRDPAVIPTAIPVVAYAASCLAKQWIPPDPHAPVGADPEDHHPHDLDKLRDICHLAGVPVDAPTHATSFSAPGIVSNLLANALMKLLKELIDEYLQN